MCNIKKEQLVGTENRLVADRAAGWGVGKVGEGGQRSQASNCTMSEFRDMRYGVVTTVNNAVLHIFELLRKQFQKVSLQKKELSP